MSQADGKAELKAELQAAGLLDGDAEFLPLAGGVSCDVWKVETAQGPIVVKRPLEQLRVQADWHAPVERSRSEVRWLRRVQGIRAGLVLEILAEFSSGCAFAMKFLENAPVWKDELMSGHVDIPFAAAVGEALAAIHSATANNAKDRVDFQTDALFHALRIEPFLLFVAEQDEQVRAPLQALARDLAQRKIALVHGDMSPKNILIHRGKPVFLDAETAVYGDPAFDLAFCITHLLLKYYWLNDPRLIDAAEALMAAYCAGVNWEGTEPLLKRSGLLVAALLLARVHGKSPAPYLTDSTLKTQIAALAREKIVAPLSLNALIADFRH